MCTAITLEHYFGRNLDLEYGYQEQVVITPRNYPLCFRKTDTIVSHFALIGMAVVDRNYPLYFDAVNEMGLAMAGLDFPGNAYYPPATVDQNNIAPFELIPWILGQCRCVEEARKLLQGTYLADISYSTDFPQAPLHWIIADKRSSIVLESTKSGMNIYENPVGVLCNNPPFPFQLDHLASYQHLSAGEQAHVFENLHLPPYGGGMGAIGLPGDFSSPSRFVKAAFVKLHSHCDQEGEAGVTHFFHLLDSVAMPRGSVRVRGDQDEITRYSCCCDLDTATYYYTTYENRRILSVGMQGSQLSVSTLQCYPIDNTPDIRYEN